MIEPERSWTLYVQNEVRRNSDGSFYHYWRANRLSEMYKGAKDSSNDLVAGFQWNFSQDSEMKLYKFLCGKDND